MSLPTKVQTYMSSHAMLPPDGRILVACSGGADSTALLRLLADLPGVTAVCAHYNHRLRGAESDRDEAFVRDLAARLGLEARFGSGDVAAYAAETGMGLEEAAREKRYQFLHEAAAETGCTRIATAHTMGDNAETVLFHLLRGAGAAGLSGISPVRADSVIRPLLCCERAELLDYLASLGQDYVEASSNGDERYARNALRKTVIPALEHLNPAAVRHICASAELLREDDAVLEAMAGSLLDAHFRDGALPLEPLRASPRPVALRALRRLCGNPGREHLERVLALCRSDARRSALDLPTLRVRKEGDALRFTPEEPAAPLPRRELKSGEPLYLPERGLTLLRTDTDFYSENREIHNSFNTFFFQSEKICDTIFVASRAPGDRIRLAGRGCTKEVRRLFTEAGLSPAERTRRLVFSDGAGVVAVEGFGTAERVSPAPGRPAIRIELRTEGLPPERDCLTAEKEILWRDR